MADLRAQLEITADASGVEAGVSKAKRSLTDLGVTGAKAGKEAAGGLEEISKGGARSAQKVDASTRNMIASIQRTTAALEAGGKSNAKYFELLASQRGVDTGSLKPYLDQLDAASAKQVSTGLSAKQLSASLRGVPAQFTDIATSIAAGQNPLTVFLQQGGQLKDMFGGIGPAAKALGGYVASLINPFTLAAGAAGALALAYYQGSKEADAYNRALILTGNAAGTTASQLGAMAKRISDNVGTQGAAAAALAELAGTGRIGAENLEFFARVAVQMEKTVGQSAKETAKNLIDLAKAPLEASIKLNEQYRYLTQATYGQIKALEELGRMEEAGAVAQSTYLRAFDERTQKIERDLGWIESAWEKVGSEAKKAWDQMLNVGRPVGDDEEMTNLDARIANMRRQIEVSGPNGRAGLASQTFGEELDSLLDQKSALDTNLRLTEWIAGLDGRRAKDAEDRAKWDKEGAEYLTKQEKSVRAIAKAEAEGLDLLSKGLITQREYDTRIANIAEKFKDKGAINLGVKLDKAALTADLGAIESAYAALAGSYDNAERILDAKRAANLVTESEYWEEKRKFIHLNEQAETDALQKRIDRLQAEKAVGEHKIKNEQDIAELAEKIATVRARASSAIEVQSIQEKAAIERVKQSYEEARAAAQDYLDTIARQYERELDGAGRGALNRERDGRRNSTDERYERERQNLARDLRRKQITPEQYDEELRLNEEMHRKALAQDEDYWEKKLELQGRWEIGASEALQNYLDRSRDVSKMTEDLFTNAFQGMEDGLVNFVMTGKASFGDLVRSIIAGLIRIQIQKTIVGLFGLMTGAPTAAASIPAAAFSGPSYSAAGGFDIPAGVNPITQLHQKEMVLPAPEADLIRSLARGGTGMASGSSGAVNVQVVINSGGSTETKAPGGMEQFGREIGQFVEAKFHEMQARSFRQGGRAWQVMQGAG